MSFLSIITIVVGILVAVVIAHIISTDKQFDKFDRRIEKQSVDNLSQYHLIESLIRDNKQLQHDIEELKSQHNNNQI